MVTETERSIRHTWLVLAFLSGALLSGVFCTFWTWEVNARTNGKKIDEIQAAMNQTFQCPAAAPAITKPNPIFL